jgi:hypothetical protein
MLGAGAALLDSDGVARLSVAARAVGTCEGALSLAVGTCATEVLCGALAVDTFGVTLRGVASRDTASSLVSRRGCKLAGVAEGRLLDSGEDDSRFVDHGVRVPAPTREPLAGADGVP